MEGYIVTAEGRVITEAQAGRDLYWYMIVFDNNKTPEESAMFFELCRQRLEQEGDPGQAELKELFRRIAASAGDLHAEALDRGWIRRAGGQ